MPVDRRGLTAGAEVGASNRCRAVLGEPDHLGDAGNGDGLAQFRVPADEGPNVSLVGGLADAVSHVDRKEVTAVQVAVHGVEPNMVGIDEPGMTPVGGCDGGCGRGPHALRGAPDETVLAVRLVPDRSRHHPGCGQLLKGSQLGLGFVGEAVTNTKRKPGKGEHGKPSWRSDCEVKSIRSAGRAGDDDS